MCRHTISLLSSLRRRHQHTAELHLVPAPCPVAEAVQRRAQLPREGQAGRDAVRDAVRRLPAERAASGRAAAALPLPAPQQRSVLQVHRSRWIGFGADGAVCSGGVILFWTI